MRALRAARRWGPGQRTFCSKRCNDLHYTRRWNINDPFTANTGMGNPHKARAVAEYVKMMEIVNDTEPRPDTLIV